MSQVPEIRVAVETTPKELGVLLRDELARAFGSDVASVVSSRHAAVYEEIAALLLGRAGVMTVRRFTLAKLRIGEPGGHVWFERPDGLPDPDLSNLGVDGDVVDLAVLAVLPRG